MLMPPNYGPAESLLSFYVGSVWNHPQRKTRFCKKSGLQDLILPRVSLRHVSVLNLSLACFGRQNGKRKREVEEDKKRIPQWDSGVVLPCCGEQLAIEENFPTNHTRMTTLTSQSNMFSIEITSYNPQLWNLVIYRISGFLDGFGKAKYHVVMTLILRGGRCFEIIGSLNLSECIDTTIQLEIEAKWSKFF